jgi:SAM-dependent methyltransferase
MFGALDTAKDSPWPARLTAGRLALLRRIVAPYALHDCGQPLAMGMLDHLAFHLSEGLHRRRAHGLVAQLLAVIDLDELRRIECKYRGDPTGRMLEFFDAHAWAPRDGALAHRLGLQRGDPKSILDLGCGFGYFLLACELLGHRAIGIAPEGTPLGEVSRVLGVRWIDHRIEAFQPLPAIPGEPFDVITASRITFNNHNRSDVWDVPEWRFFLEDLAGHAKPGARVLLMFNVERTLGWHLSDRLYRAFRDQGALVRRAMGLVQLTVPLS